MGYTLTRVIKDTELIDLDPRVREALAEKGFGVLTEIDVSQTLKQKIGADLAPDRVLGACNPHMAYQAIGIEPRVGAMLPCNVILRQIGPDVEVSSIDPVASMQAIDNAELKAVAGEVRDMLRAVIETV